MAAEGTGVDGTIEKTNSLVQQLSSLSIDAEDMDNVKKKSFFFFLVGKSKIQKISCVLQKQMPSRDEKEEGRRPRQAIQKLQKIQLHFIKLCFTVHPEAIKIELSPSSRGRIATEGQVFGQHGILGCYKLVCDPKGFRLMRTPRRIPGSDKEPKKTFFKK